MQSRAGLVGNKQTKLPTSAVKLDAAEGPEKQATAGTSSARRVNIHEVLVNLLTVRGVLAIRDVMRRSWMPSPLSLTASNRNSRSESVTAA